MRRCKKIPHAAQLNRYKITERQTNQAGKQVGWQIPTVAMKYVFMPSDWTCVRRHVSVYFSFICSVTAATLPLRIYGDIPHYYSVKIKE
jgi:hypothetical protein